MVKRQDHQNICHLLLLLLFQFCFSFIFVCCLLFVVVVIVVVVQYLWLRVYQISKDIHSSKNIYEKERERKSGRSCFYSHIVSTFAATFMHFQPNEYENRVLVSESWFVGWLTGMVWYGICVCLSMKSIRWTKHIFTWKQCKI